MTARHPAPRPAGPPVLRGVLFASPLVEIRDNRCNRHDPALSPPTPPMAFDEITFPRDGLWCRHLGRRALPVDARHVHFFPRGESHRVSHPIGCGDRNTGFLFEPATLAAMARPRGASPFPATHVPITARLHAAHLVVLRAARAAAEQRIDPLAVEELALRLASACLASEARPAPASTKRQRELIEATRAVLHCDLERRVTLGEIAAAVGCSPFHLCRTFAAHCGEPLLRYRQRLRLLRAAELIVETRAPLADVAARTGCADRSHLTRLLRRELGTAPARLRKDLEQARFAAALRALTAPADGETPRKNVHAPRTAPG
jgi:AraC-like DNA-binding protein